MSNVERVERFMAGFPDDAAAALASEEGRRAWEEVVREVTRPDFDVAMIAPILTQEAKGLDGYFALWADWLEPFDSYRLEFERVIPAGANVVVFVRQFGRLKGSEAEVSSASASVHVFEDGLTARIEFHMDREAALRAAGLDPQPYLSSQA
ncbi:MAG: nuclear transport factor 2 family protein [Actinomycetota bacterium]|nr:nuclear transport factor 2 family protein [Actinomycetota bacterium]